MILDDFGFVSVMASTAWDVIWELNQLTVFGLPFINVLIIIFIADICIGMVRILVFGSGGWDSAMLKRE